MEATNSKAKSLTEVLVDRGVSEETIEEMKKEKLDETRLCLMSDDELQKYLPSAGDRLFIRSYCSSISGSQQFPTDDARRRKDNLLSKLRKKLGIKRDRHDSSDEDEQTHKKLTGNKNAEKKERKVQLGWLHYGEGRYKQVRIQNGGGTRLMTIQKDAKKDVLMQEALKIFFPGGKSCKGRDSSFDMMLLNLSKQEVGSDETVADLYNTFKTPLLRIYLATKWKVESTEHETVDLSSGDSGDSESFFDPFENFEPFYDLNVASEIEKDTSSSVMHESAEDFTLNEPLLAQGDSGTPTIQFNTVQRDCDPLLNSTPRGQVIIRRSNVVEDFIQICSDPNIMSKTLDVRMIHMNGDVEAGEGDGVFRDALTEFWSVFGRRYTNGNVYKVPIIRHDFGKQKWEAIARILVKGFKDTGYFPIILAPAFMEQCMFGIHNGDILESFMHYVSDFERDVLQKALANFPEDTDELLDIMDGYDCKQLPTSENLGRLLQEIAHKELIQKPMFIVDCWRPVIASSICHDLDQKRFWSLYTDLAPTVKKVTGLIKTPTELSGTEKVMLGYVKKYIRSLSEQDLKIFLRFCTGADILICPSLYITFNQQDGFGRSPVAHTCTTTVEIPTTYESFAEFKNELDEILKSNIWIMDLK